MSDAREDFFASGAGDSPKTASRDDFFSGDLKLDEVASTTKEEKGTALPGQIIARATGKAVSSMGAGIAGGAREIYDLISGKGIAESNKRYHEFVKANTYAPPDEASAQVADVFNRGMASPFNPLNAPAAITDEMARQVTKPSYEEQLSHQLWEQSGGKIGKPPDIGGNPSIAPILSGALQFAAGAAPVAGAMMRRPVPGAAVTPEEVPPQEAVSELELAPTQGRALPQAASPEPSAPLTASGATRAAPFEPQDIPGRPGIKMDTEPVEGGLPETAASPRADILKRVGLENARDSALKGDAKSAATDFQMSRFDEPAGVQAKAQFDTERQALQAHAEKIVRETGGTQGLDEDALHARGQTIAKPFDDLRQWFDTQTKRLYAAADERAQGAPVSNLESVDAVLKDPKFRNSLLAKNQGPLLNAVEGQLEEFRKGNPQGFSVASAEEMRQWLNQIWTNDNRYAVGKLKDALDNDVLKGAGEDIYGSARAIVQQRKATLDNPKGIASLMDADPQTPLNRVTPHAKVPDTLMRLDPAQFENVVKTLKEMPEDLQPQAQAALAEMRAQAANKLLEAGEKHQTQWNAQGVSKVLKTNSAKLRLLFEDNPKALQDISDLDSAGKILRVDSAYPGAAAQAANAMKRGFMSRAMSKAGATAGAAAGGIFGPFGAAGGAAAGETLGSKAGASMAERAAVKQWKSKVTPLTPLNTP
jgi:hypothetical protein